MLKSSSFLAIPHSKSDFSVYAVDTYPFPVDNHSVHAADTQFFLVDYHRHTVNCDISRQVELTKATKGKEATATADNNDDEAVIDAFKSDKESEIVSF